MKNWLRNIRGAFGMGLLWASGGSLAALVLTALPFERFVDPDGAAVMGGGMYSGFFGGLVFFIVLRIAERRRRLDELSFPRAAAWGAVTALLLPVLFALALAAGLGDVKGPIPWLQVAAIIGAMTLGMSVAASASVALAKWWRHRSATA